MIIIRPDDQAGASGKVGSQFTGEVHPYLALPSTDGVVINTVSFNPGARTHWHSHERGQILFVLSGRGLVQSEGGPVEVLRQGDTVWVPAGERHWHGAGPEATMTHTAVSLGVTSWDDPVTDAEYGASRH
ncbi:cupin domain-containing protein [Leucobacter weissii]|uniref:Cupin domain-containing protein n=1 Tax=Leucobacter weissii TaxID=1983706 RepID=A0A939MJW6_9MICO|nr:cupin domain-containing protein [Leucobacter weissii]MBO1902324.1 cupin domain-containing protein [Leucobacter weissii]